MGVWMIYDHMRLLRLHRDMLASAAVRYNAAGATEPFKPGTVTMPVQEYVAMLDGIVRLLDTLNIFDDDYTVIDDGDEGTAKALKALRRAGWLINRRRTLGLWTDEVLDYERWQREIGRGTGSVTPKPGQGQPG